MYNNDQSKKYKDTTLYKTRLEYVEVLLQF